MHINYDSIGYREIGVKHFDLGFTIRSAQPLTFYADYDSISKTLVYPSEGKIINLREIEAGKSRRIGIASKSIDYAVYEVKRRFRLGDRLSSIYGAISTDATMEGLIQDFRGMRITLNDPWETTMCYILSQYNNVPRIRGITKRMIARFGSDIFGDHDNVVGKAFPKSHEIAAASEKSIIECGAGFRAKYIVEAADYCTNNIDMARLGKLDYPELKEELLQIKGVGDKVADCIALFGYGKLEAFPVDVWIKRTVERLYFRGRKKSIKEIHRFAEDKWGRYAGVAQQYLFFHGISGGLDGNGKKK